MPHDITITLTDEQHAAVAAGEPDVTAFLQGKVDDLVASYVKAADDKRFSDAGLPNLRYFGLDDEQCALLIANNAPKHAAKLAALAAEAEAARLAAEAEAAKP